jgi:bifunctional enzyme CysN/CysC
MDLLRFITCGSVDDGKSTLIGRLLHDCAALSDDQLAKLGAEPDFAHLLDGLSDEREQGITIDVAWRYFGTPRRRFIIGDCPGHEQYTRNMVTGASVAEAAVLLVDARKGVLSQTRRHAAILALLGVRALVLAVNKMDLAGFDATRFKEVAEAFAQVAARLGLPVRGADADRSAGGDPERERSRRWAAVPVSGAGGASRWRGRAIGDRDGGRRTGRAGRPGGGASGRSRDRGRRAVGRGAGGRRRRGWPRHRAEAGR